VATLVGAFGTSAVISGFLQGFLLFLAIPIDVGIPFGGLDVVGATVAIGLWLFVLHVLLLTGWAATDALDRRLRGHPDDEGAGEPVTDEPTSDAPDHDGPTPDDPRPSPAAVAVGAGR
jgi:membrane protein